MKIISSIKKVAIAMTLFFGVMSCSDDDSITVDPATAIPAIVTADADLSSLLAALNAADGDLVSVLGSPGPFTVLAPTNEAFASFLADKGFTELSEVPTDVLTQILLNHVIPLRLSSDDLTGLGNRYVNTGSNAGPDNTVISLFFNATTEGVSFNGVSDVIDADIAASNGIIHKVDAVIDLPTVVTFVTADPNLSSLAAALTGAGLVPALSVENGTGTPEAPFTIFAPIDTAFETLLDSNPDWDSLADIPAETLAAVLPLHLIEKTNVNGAQLPSVDGENMAVGGPITINSLGGTVSGEGNTTPGEILSTNGYQATNGIIHAINQVLLPAQ